MASTPEHASSPGKLALVVAASSAGTAFEWYDFFVFGTLASTIAKHFTAGSETAGFIFALGAFAAGFVVRPFGALVFGRMGDRAGRKKTFLATIVMMGAATVAIGLLPTAAQVGFLAPMLLVATRVIQGFAMGGEYGGAAIYVAEHSPANRRGFLTSWIQTTAAFGLMLALAVILATRTLMGEEAFQAWGWRVPFILSGVLLALSLWIRLKLSESPVFQQMKEAQGVAKAPLAETFRGRNLKMVLIALVAILLAQGAVWYTAHFYAQFFLERVLKVPASTVNLLLMSSVLLSSGLYVFFGWLSDKIGRKPVMLFGMVLAVASYVPGFHMLTAQANPALQAAAVAAPVVVLADPGDCALQFDPLGQRQFTSACDVAKRILSDAGVPYTNQAAKPGTPAVVRVGGRAVASVSLKGLDPVVAKAERQRVTSDVKDALKAAAYPLAADPARIDLWRVLAVLLVFMVAATALYGPQAAALVELFPTRVRYTAFSIPYNVGTGWVGGFLPVTAFALVAATGDLYFGLVYPIIFTVISIIATVFLLPETKGQALDALDGADAA
ncbi:MAG: MFS transporter [Caulobacteraceae bacterium]